MPVAEPNEDGLSEKALRFNAMRDGLEARAHQEAEAMGQLTAGFREQVGIDADKLLIGALGPEGGVFFITPFFGEYPGPNGDDPWQQLRNADGRQVFDGCRFIIDADALPQPQRYGEYWRFQRLWPDPVTCEPQAAEDFYTPEDLLAEGYANFGQSETMANGSRATLVEHPDLFAGRFDKDAALDFYAGERGVTRSMALSLFRWESGFAELGGGARVFWFNEPGFDSNSDRMCVVEGIAWEQFRLFEVRGGEGPLRDWCREAFASHDDAVDERRAQRWRESGPPQIRTIPVPGQ